MSKWPRRARALFLLFVGSALWAGLLTAISLAVDIARRIG